MNVGWWNTTMPDATSTAVDFFEQQRIGRLIALMLITKIYQ